MNGIPLVRGSLVGDNLSLVPYQSAFGCAARLARLNQIRVPAEYKELLGIKTSESQTLLGALSTSRAQQQALAGALGIARPTEWEPARWYPFQTSIPNEAIFSRFRYCLACIRLGFHSNLHQLPWIYVCPWHRTRLRVGCPRCGQEPCTSARSGIRLLTCVCGFDLVNESASALQRGAARHSAELQLAYLEWCGHLSKVTHLIFAPGVPIGREQLGRLIAPPPSLHDRPSSHHTNVRSYWPGQRAATPHTSHELGSLALGWAVSIVDSECPAFRYIAGNVAKMSGVPRLSRLDVVRLGLPELLDGEKPIDTAASLASEGRILHPQLLHPVQATFLLRMVEACDRHSDSDDASTHHTAALVHRVHSALLYRAYAEGMMVVACGADGHTLPPRYRRPSPLALMVLDSDPRIRLVF